MICNEVIKLLEKKGFSKEEKGFICDYKIGDFPIKLQLKFPDDFPSKLPDAFILNYDSLPLIPHVEKNGKVCLFQPGSTVIDYARPVEILGILVDKISKTLKSGLTNPTHDLVLEFLAYWEECNMTSLIKVNEQARQILCASFNKKVLQHEYIIADGKNELLSFVKRFFVDTPQLQKALYIPLKKNFPPPDFRTKLFVKNVLAFINEFSNEQTKNFFNNSLRTIKLPIILAISIPSRESRILFGVCFSKARDYKEACRGFRPNKVHASHELKFAQNDSVVKINFKRFDKDYLLKRTGGNDTLNNKKVLIIGVGSVGGYVSEYLASIGIENIAIIDKDTLTNENLYRHCLGIQYVGKKKVEALKEYLELKYKDINITPYNFDINEGIAKETLNADIIISLTGDENANRRINREISKDIPLLFGWIEPLGIGTHIVSSNIANIKGCLECLYLSNEGEFSPNRAMFCQPNQNVRKIYAGCSGSFLPYSNLDAVKLALEISYSTVDIFSGKVKKNFLKSTFGNKEIFLNEKLLLTEKASLFKDGECKTETAFSSKFCKKCNGLDKDEI